MTENYTNSSTIDTKPFDCLILKFVGIYCILIFIISIASNVSLIWVLLSNKKKLLHQFNILIFALAVLSLLGAIVDLPLVIITSFECRYFLII